MIPEKPFEIEEVCKVIRHRHERGRDFSIVVVAEGASFKANGQTEGKLIMQDAEVDAFGHVRLGGIGSFLAREIENRTGFESRVVILGHIQRGGSPTAFDRVLATRFGIAAIDLVKAEGYGKMVALQGSNIVTIPISDAVKKLKTVSEELYQVAEVFFG